jgi:spermidine synthase
MAGLALGSWVVGRTADRLRNPLRFFGVVEVLIGVTALAVPHLLRGVESFYAEIHTRLPETLAALTLARFACSFAILLLPTLMMGATLPLAVKSSLFREQGLGTRFSLLYAANTAGGIAGAVLAGFYLVGGVGVSVSHQIAAALNLAVGISALALSATLSARLSGPVAEPDPPSLISPTPVLIPERVRRRVLLVFALSGFAALALEVVWFRLLLIFLPATTYAFTTMLATVLGGIAAGSAIMTPRMRGNRDWVRTLARLQMATAVVALLSLTALAHTYRAGWRTSGMIQGSVLAIFPATALMGAAFPVGMYLWAKDAGERGTRLAGRIGSLNAVNLCGAIVGSVIGGFVVLPLLGSRLGLVAIAAVYLGCAVLLLAILPDRRSGARAGAIGAAAFALAALSLPDPFAAVLARRYPGEQLLWREEGVQTTVTVHRRPEGVQALYLDGLHQASDSPEMVELHRRIGHLPLALHASPKTALVLGLGGGATAGAVSQHREIEVDLVELAPSVIRGASWFRHINYDLLGQPGVRLRVDDGRNYLLLSSKRYDVVTADLIQPFHAGAGSLYSLEYYQLARARLREDGLMLQWIGHPPETQYKLILRTFLAAFPETTLWAGGSMMVGAKGRLRIDRAGFERKLERAETRAALTAVGIDSYDALRALYQAGPEELREFAGQGLLLTDDRPLVEYHRSLPRHDPPVDLAPLRGEVNRHLPP